MTYAEIQAEVVRRLEERAGALVAVTTTAVQAAINAGYMEMSDATEWNEQWVHVALLASRPYYDVRTVIGDDVLGIGDAFHVDTNRWMVPTGLRVLDRNDRRWERVQQAPQRVILRGLWWLRYWPDAQASIGTMKQYYTALPTALSDDTDEPGFPDDFHYGLVEFALWDLFGQDARGELAVAAWQAYLPYETGLQGWVDGRLGAPLDRGYGHDRRVAR